MSGRIIEISSPACYVSVKRKQLIIEQEGDVIGQVPIEDMAALVIDHPQTVLTQKCSNQLLENNVVVISSDATHQPIAMLLPLVGHTLQTERFIAQANLSQPTKKSLWKQLIQSKIKFQGKVLESLTENDAGLKMLVKKVRSGDPANVEGQAARRYWSRLFGTDGTFRRDRDAEDQNRFLNYGYAVLRALCARSLCAAGLHPTLGLHHKNRYNAFCLADDLMEPFRPFVDLKVHQLVLELGVDHELNKETRALLLEMVYTPTTFESEEMPLINAIQRSAQSLAQVVMQERKALLLPSY